MLKKVEECLRCSLGSPRPLTAVAKQPQQQNPTQTQQRTWEVFPPLGVGLGPSSQGKPLPCSRDLFAGVSCSRYPQAHVAPGEPSEPSTCPSTLFPLTVLPTVYLLLLWVDLFILGSLLPGPGPQLQEAVHKLEHLGLTWQDDVAAGSFQNMTQ